MPGFIEFEVTCPKCNKNTGTLDVGYTYEDFNCNNKECNYNHSVSFNDKVEKQMGDTK